MLSTRRHIAWLLLDRVATLAISAIASVLIARLFGPSQFGDYSFALSYVAVFISLGNLGIDQFLIRQLASADNDRATTLGSAFALRLVSSGFATVAAMVIAVGLSAWVSMPIALIALLCPWILLQNLDIASRDFLSRNDSSAVVAFRSITSLLMAVTKVTLAAIAVPVAWFALLPSIDAGLRAITSYGLAVHRSRSPLAWSYSPTKVRELARHAVPLGITALMATIYLRADQIMVALLSSDSEAGNLAAAAKVAELWQFVPVTVIGGVTPRLARDFDSSYEAFKARFTQLSQALIALSYAAAFICWWFSPQLIAALFGVEYETAAGILAVYAWSGVFVTVGCLLTLWHTCVGTTSEIAWATTAGAVSNIALNAALIPRLGGAGAAWATVASYALAGFAWSALNPKSRDVFVIHGKCLLLIPLIKTAAAICSGEAKGSAVPSPKSSSNAPHAVSVRPVLARESK